MFKGFNGVKKELNKQNLISKLSDGCKVKEKWRIGTEHEKFGFKKNDLSPITFEDIQVIFSNLCSEFSWEKIWKLSAATSLSRPGEYARAGPF